ncbi:hypothetical protein, partial [Xanthomonas oryzae]|uniref:hypothetical protein n=1 Tax=Xanthomonas oryzae TaxID=347 RepID=UPI001C527C94
QDLACADEWDPSGIPLCRNHGCLNTKGLWSLHVFRVRMAVRNFGGTSLAQLLVQAEADDWPLRNVITYHLHLIAQWPLPFLS